MQMLLAFVLCLLVESEHARWIQAVVESDDEQARATLLRKGTPALGELAAALAATKDPQAKKRLESIIRQIKANEPHGLSFFVGLPKMKLTPQTDVTFVVTVRNKSDKTVVLYPYLSLHLLAADGTEVKPARRLGRHGLRPPGHPLDAVKFVTLKPGERWSIQEELGRYMHDPLWITGWKTPGVGVYTLEFTYAYDAKQAAGIEDKNHPARSALAFEHTFRQEMRIQP
jgi:hypothetical protein